MFRLIKYLNGRYLTTITLRREIKLNRIAGQLDSDTHINTKNDKNKVDNSNTDIDSDSKRIMENEKYEIEKYNEEKELCDEVLRRQKLLYPELYQSDLSYKS
jgi:hypothetical protein